MGIRLQAAWIELNAIYERCQIVQINGQRSRVWVCLFGKMGVKCRTRFWACNGKCGVAVYKAKNTRTCTPNNSHTAHGFHHQNARHADRVSHMFAADFGMENIP